MLITNRRAMFGRLNTWIVGIQNHDGVKGLESREVFFDRDPDNPFDPNAVAVYTRDGREIGHLPRYDAEYFSPLMAEGVVMLKGHAGESERGDRLPLAHEQVLYPKTQFLYRMLKAHIEDLKRLEEGRLREQVLASIAAMKLGHVTGWSELTVIPIDADGAPAETSAAEVATSTALATIESHWSGVLRLLPSRCPYPSGAHGAVVLVHGDLFSLDWFDIAECAQV